MQMQWWSKCCHLIISRITMSLIQGVVPMGLRSLTWEQLFVIPVNEFTSIYSVTVNEESFAPLGSQIGNITTFHEISLKIVVVMQQVCQFAKKKSLPLSLPLQMALEKVTEAGFFLYLLRWTGCPMGLVQKVSSEARKLSDFPFPGLFCTCSVFSGDVQQWGKT